MATFGLVHSRVTSVDPEFVSLKLLGASGSLAEWCIT